MNITYVNFWDSLAFCLEIYFFYTCFLDEKKSFPIIPRYLLLFILAASSYLLNPILPAGGTVWFLTELILPLFLIFEGKTSKKITTAVLLFLGILIIESVTLSFLSFRYDPLVITDTSSALYQGLFTPTQHLNMGIFIIILRSLLKDRKFQSTLSYYLVQLVIPALSIVTIIYLFQSSIEVTTMRFLTYVLLLINITAYLMSRLNERLYHVNTVQQMEKQMLEQKESYYGQLDQYQQEIRMIRHDFKNTLLMISPYINEETVLHEVNKMLDYTSDMEHAVVFCSHTGLNVLLNEKVQYARDQGIQCNFDIFVPAEMNISANDIGILIGNLINNAIEAVSDKDMDRYINLSMIYYNHSLSIMIENPIESDVTDLSTSKTDIRNHGLGTRSIDRVVEKYHGTYEWQGTGKVFCTTILLWEQAADQSEQM